MIEVKTEIKKYLKYCSLEKKLSKHTLKAYRIDLAQFIAFKPDISISKEDLTKYIQYLHKTYKPKTIKRKIATLKAFVHYLYYKDIIEFNPFDKIDTTFKEPLHLPHTIPENIIHQLLTASYQNILTAATTHQKLVSVRNTAIIELLFATGARISEICSLKINNIDFASKTVRIFGKGAKERILQIENRDVIAILMKYLILIDDSTQPNSYLFQNNRHNRISEQSVRTIIRNLESRLQRHYILHHTCSDIP